MQTIQLVDGSRLVLKSMDTVIEKADAGPIVAVVSTEQVDDIGDVIHQAPSDKGRGWLLDRFNAAPLMLWQHDRWAPNMAAPGTRAYVGERNGVPALLLDAVFDDGDQAASLIEGKVRRGSIKETSVGFRAMRENPRESKSGVDFFEQELIEVSWCNRGMNPYTDVLAKSLMRRPEMIGLLEDGGDPEVGELKDLVADLAERLKVAEGLISQIGDSLAARQEIDEQKAATLKAWDAAAVQALKALQRVGVVSE